MQSVQTLLTTKARGFGFVIAVLVYSIPGFNQLKLMELIVSFITVTEIWLEVATVMDSYCKAI